MIELVLLAVCPLLDGGGELVHTPAPQAQELNNQGKKLYRQGRWDDARQRYRAALEADPAWPAPALNVACSLARQERFAEAAAEAAALVRRSFVPWGREVREAADLAPLQIRPERATVEQALAEAGSAWGRGLIEALLFVARTRPPVRLTGDGVLVLGLNQEIFAWLPVTGQYRQVTAEDGRVLAFVRSPDGRKIAYVRAGKLVRPSSASGRASLRGLSLRVLDLTSMTSTPPVPVDGDLTSLELWFANSSAAELRIEDASGIRLVRFDGALAPMPALSPASKAVRPVVLTAAGVTGGGLVTGPSACPFHAANQAARIRITSGRKTRLLDAPFGAGLFGMAF